MATQKEKLIAEAQRLVEKGQYERAVKLYLRVVAEDDKDVRVWLKVGDLYTKLRKSAEAAETYLHVAEAYSEQGFYTKAIAVYKQILKLDPSLVKVHERLADLYRQMGLIPDAIDQYSQVAAFHGKDGDARQALQALKQIVELDPQNVATRVKLAELYSREQMVREAIDEFAVAADQLHEQGRVDDYMKVAERLLYHSPDNRPVSRELACLYLERGDARKALPRLQVCFKADPRDVDTLALLAEAFQALGQTLKAVSVLKELARIQLENGNAAEREQTFQRIHQLDPTDAEVRLALEQSAANRAQAARRSDRASQPPPLPPSQRSPSVPVRPVGAAQAVAAAAAVSAQSLPSLPDLATADTVDALTGRPPSVPPQHKPVSGRFPSYSSSPRLEPAPLDDEEIAKILAETEVFAKYNLHAKALEHVRSILDRSPHHLAARDKLKSVLMLLGRDREALDELRLLAEQTVGTAHEAGYLDEILALSPGDEWARGRHEALARHLERQQTPVPPRRLPRGPAIELPPPSRDLYTDSRVEAPFDRISLPLELGGEHDADGLRSAPIETLDPLQTLDDDDDEFAVVVDEMPAQPLGADGLAGGGEALAAVGWSGGSQPPQPIEDRFGEDLDLPAASGSRPGAGGRRDPDSLDLGAPQVMGLDSLGPLVAAAVDSTMEPAVDPMPDLTPEVMADAWMVLPGDDGRAVLDDSGVLGPAARAEPQPAPEAIDNFDFSSFDDPSSLAERAAREIASAPNLSALLDREPAPLDPPPAPPAALRSPGEGDRALAQLAASTPAVSITATVDTMPVPARAAPAAHSAIDDGLEEAEFYVAQGMIEEAREVLQGLLTDHPFEPRVSARLIDLRATRPGSAAAAPPIAASIAPVAARPAPVPGPAPGDVPAARPATSRPQLLVAEPAAASARPKAADEAAPTAAVAADVSEGTRRRRSVVEKGVSDDDFESHFDLGIAYKEMGLLEEAIAEFQVAMRDAAREVQCQQMIGLTYLAKGQPLEAVRHFKAGLHAATLREDEELSLYYELGTLYQSLGERKEARYYYERIAKRKPRYRDTERRIEALNRESDAFAPTPAALRK